MPVWLSCVAVAVVLASRGGLAAGRALAAVSPQSRPDVVTLGKTDAPVSAPGGLRVELVKSAPQEGTLRVGGAASFEARLFSGGREIPLKGSVCRWHSDNGARFLESEGPSRNTVVFTRPGRQRVWVEVVSRERASHGLSAVSEAVPVEVGNPVFNMTVTPPDPLVGEAITVSIRDFPLHDGVAFHWDPLSPKAKLLSVSERGLTFYLTEATAIPVRVSATVGGDGVDLGVAAVRVTARPYGVTVENKGLAEPPAVVWQAGEGPVTAKGVAVGQRVRLRAAVTPGSKHPPLRYAWSLCAGAQIKGPADGRDIVVSRRKVGPCAATVSVRDSRGLLLGQGKGAFMVAIPQARLDEAVHNGRATERLVAEAKRAWQTGAVDRALALAERAATLSPSNAPAMALRERLTREHNRLRALLSKAGHALTVDDFDEVAAMLDKARTINPRAGAIAAVARDTARRQALLAKVGRILAEARDKWDAGAVEVALTLTGQALALDPNHPGARAERERMVAGRDRLIAALKQSAAYLAHKRFDSAATALAEARAVNVRFPALAEMERAIAARKARAWHMDERLARARDQWNAGDADGAVATLTEAAALDPEHAGADKARKALVETRARLGQAEDRAETALAAGRLDEARTALAEAGRLCPRHPRLAELTTAVADRADRGKRLAEQRTAAGRALAAGDLDGAIAALGRMQALSPKDPSLAAKRDRLIRMREALDDALSRAQSFLDDRHYDLALAALAEAEQQPVRVPRIAPLKQRILDARRQAEQAVKTSLAALRTQLAKGDWQAAGQSLAAVKKLGPLAASQEQQVRDGERRLTAGLIHQEAARREQAMRRRTAAAGTTDIDRRARCAAIGRDAATRRKAGDHAGAIRGYQALLELCPDTCPAYNNVGTSLYSLGYVAESVPWFDEAVKCAPGERLFRDNAAMTRKRLSASADPASDAKPDCSAAFAAADAQRQAGDLVAAIRGYQVVVARCPRFCAAYNNLGLSLHKLGRTGEALPQFEKAWRCNPKDNLFRQNYDLTAKRLRAGVRRP